MDLFGGIFYNFHIIFLLSACFLGFKSTFKHQILFLKSSHFSPVSFYPSFPLIHPIAPESLANVWNVWTQPTVVLTWPSAFQGCLEACSLLRAASSMDIAALARTMHALARDVEDQASVEQDPLHPHAMGCRVAVTDTTVSVLSRCFLLRV